MPDTPPLPDKLRVIFTGHAGTSKGRVAERFAEFVSKRLKALGSDRTVKWADAEALLKPMPAFLAAHRSIQEGRWLKSVTRAIQDCADADYAFLSIHLSLRSYNRFLSPISWRTSTSLKSGKNATTTLLSVLGDQFEPDYCVCLIDDIQSVQQRIAEGDGGIHLRLQELLAWRNLESMLTDFLAQETILRRGKVPDPSGLPFDRSPVVATRHPFEMLFRYLVQPQLLRIYASFPITRTRGNADSRGEIDDFRKALHSTFCVFDPVTIDELPVRQLLESDRERVRVSAVAGAQEALRDSYDLPAQARWPLDVETTLSGHQIVGVNGIQRPEIEEILRTTDGRDRTEIARSVEDRDLRLVDQADCVVVYRPQYSTGIDPGDKRNYQKPTGGTGAEIDHALRIGGKPVYIVHDAAVDGEFSRDVLDRVLPEGDLYYIEGKNLADPENRQAVLDKLLKQLLKDQGQLVRRRS